MIEWLLGGAVALLLFSGAGKEEVKQQQVPPPDDKTGKGKLPISGIDRSKCPSVTLPKYQGTGKGTMDEIPAALRKVYSDALKIDPALISGGGEMGKAIRDASAETTHNLGLQAECAGYLDAAKQLYETADKISKATPGSTTMPLAKNAIATDATTDATLARDFSELPEKIKTYVTTFVDDPTITPDILTEGADVLTSGTPSVGSYGLYPSARRHVGLEPFSLDPTIATDVIDTAEDALGTLGTPKAKAYPVDFGTFDPTEMAKWYFPKAAARLRRIAIERAADMSLPNPFPGH